jgi:type I restriction enzyme M protein
VSKGHDLSAKNPNTADDPGHLPALELIQSIRTKEDRIAGLLGELEALLEQ